MDSASRPATHSPPHKDPFLAPPKTGASHRTIPLPHVVVTTLAEHLRHYYASLLIRHDESVKTVQRRLGHATAAETLDTYSHLWPDSDDRTRDAIDAVLGPGVPQVYPKQPARVIFTQVSSLGRTSWPISRILCTGCLAASRPTVILLGLPSPAGSSGLPAGIGRATLDRLRSAPKPARLLALLRVGFTEPPRSPGTLVVSYTAVSPLPRLRGAVCFLWHYPAGHPGLPLATTLP
jgi:hypothetical protein